MSRRLVTAACTAALWLTTSHAVLAATINGGEGNDTILGTPYDDVINGRAGDDTISGLDGNDSLSGGGGIDTIDGGAGNDSIGASNPDMFSLVLRLFGGYGNDMVSYGGIPLPGSVVDGGPGGDEVGVRMGINPFQFDLSGSTLTDLGDLSFIKGFEKWIINASGYARITDANLEGLESQLTVVFHDGGWGIDASAVTSGGISFQVTSVDSFPQFLNGRPRCMVMGSSKDDEYKQYKPTPEWNVIGDDYFCGNGGNDYFDGGDGVDISQYSGNRGDYTVTEIAYNTFTVTDNRPGSPDGTDTIIDVNKLQFADQTVNVVIRGLYIVGDENGNVLVGGGESDLIDGKGGDDDLIGGAGNDTTLGSAGNDALEGGPGGDILNGGDGSDTAVYGDASAGVTVDLQTPATNSGEALGDSYVSVENIVGSGSGDSLTGNGAGNVISGGAGNDAIHGGAGNDTLNGDAGTAAASPLIRRAYVAATGLPGADVLAGGRGNDTINGGDGTDTAVYNGKFADYFVSYNATTRKFTIADKVALRDDTDTVSGVEVFRFADGARPASSLMVNGVYGTGGVDKLVGTAAADVIRGLGGNDTLTGNGGNDALDGGAGADAMEGGLGNDSYYVDNAADKVTESASGGIDTVYTSLPGYTLPSNVENLVYTGNARFAGKGNEIANRITGGPAGDRLDGLKGNDVLIGGPGDDSYLVDSAADLVTEAANAGRDGLTSSVTITRLAANVEVLSLGPGNINGTGNALDNTLIGGAGNNVLSGGDGADTLVGGLGDDAFYGETSAAAGNDADTVSYAGAPKGVVFSLAVTSAAQNTVGAGSDRIFPMSRIENLTGSAFADKLTGSAVGNVMRGGAGDDTLAGLAGADVLFGDAGRDLIDCGNDAVPDLVAYAKATDSPVGANRDQVTTFKPGSDRIDLSLMDANTALAGDQAFAFSDTTPQANSVWYSTSGADIILRGDFNGDGAPDFEVLIKGVSALQEADIVP